MYITYFNFLARVPYANMLNLATPQLGIQIFHH
jgi:hypothetical protein